jgi:putative mRNA 3-end processing factor
MKNKYPVEVSPSGAVILGHRISCDGFHRDYRVRVQTHVHSDHMDSFETSKGLQNIFMSEPTRQLLIAEFDAELPYRENIFVMEMGVPCTAEDSQICLLRSGHMLGAVQVGVQVRSGLRLGYSGDFQWPLDDVIKVDALVVDSTYGSPARKREYSQAEADSRFLALVLRQLKRGPVHVNAHRGTLQRGLQVLSGQIDCSLVASARLCSEVEVYREHGYSIAPIAQANTGPGKVALKEGKYIRVYGMGDQLPVEIGKATMITLSAYMSRPDDPVMEFSDCSYSVALSNHADFTGTIEYIRATGAQYVVTDNTRGGHAVELAQEVMRLLGIPACPSSAAWSHEWGV